MVTEKKVTHIAIDAMGGDYAPAEIVAGAVMAAKEGNIYLSLVGDYEQVKSELSKHDSKDLPVQIIPSDGVISPSIQNNTEEINANTENLSWLQKIITFFKRLFSCFFPRRGEINY